MSKKLFTNEQIIVLSNNPYVKNVSSKGITYTNEFKNIFISDNNKGLSSSEIFEKYDFDIEILGVDRVYSSGKRWKKAFMQNGVLGLEDSRVGNSGRPRTKDLTPEEKIVRLEAKIALQEKQIKLLKKLARKERIVKRILIPSEIYELIKVVIDENNLDNLVSFLCNETGVSRSGYYRYWSYKAIISRSNRQATEQERLNNITDVFHAHKNKIGSKQIKMILENDFDLTYNLKSIKRIMRKYGLECIIRKARPYAKQLKATKEHRTHDNILARQFKHNDVNKTLLTDITYIRNNGKFMYLSVVLDSNTSEVLAHQLSPNLKIGFVLDTIKGIDSSIIHPEALIHSDQGTHYTSPKYSKLVKKLGLRQSMSRRGNCWDNAPMESFFGHLKDNIEFSECKRFDEVASKIDEYINYYNNERYQWDRKKMTPVQYRDHLNSYKFFYNPSLT